MVTVKVISTDSGNPQKGERVTLGVTGGVTNAEYTDSNGEAHFDVSPGHGEIYVNGSEKFKGHLAGRHIVYI